MVAYVTRHQINEFNLISRGSSELEKDCFQQEPFDVLQTVTYNYNCRL